MWGKEASIMHISKGLLQAAIADAGSSLENPLRSRLEDGFGKRLGHIRIHRTEESFAANRGLGSLAFTTGSHICLSSRMASTGAELFSQIMAHEVAHVLQKELGSAGGDAPIPVHAGALEQEADAAAFAVLRGNKRPRLTADPSSEPRCWGPAGHYYTVFLASVQAGLPLDDCKSNAFYAQMPDQVTELDAIPAGTDWNKRLVTHGPSNANTDLMLTDWQVQIGLHSLSGWSSSAETTYRKKILDSLDPGSFEFGLALHCYGDSYAHRIMDGGARMYKAPLGHAVEILNGANPHCPDKMEMRPGLYQQYGLSLYDMFVERWQTKTDEATHQSNRRRFGAMLDAISGQADETSQIAQIGKFKSFDSDMEMRVLNSYYPEMDEEVNWNQFYLRNKLNGQGIDPGLLDRALELAETWTRGIALD
jgi:hypothetical protein